MIGWCGGFNIDNVTGGIFKYTGSINLGVQAINNPNAWLNVFPNPSNGQFSVQIAGAEKDNVMITVIDAMGKVVLSQNINNSASLVRQDLNLNGIAKGIYFVNVHNGVNHLQQKLVIEIGRASCRERV